MWRYYERGRNHDKPISFPFSFQKTSENDVSHTYYMCLLSNFNIVFPVDPGGNVPAMESLFCGGCHNGRN